MFKRAIGLPVTTLVLRAKNVVFALRSPPAAAGHIPVPEAALEMTGFIPQDRVLLHQPARRAFIKSLALGCAGVLGIRAWQTSSPSAEQNSALRLARRIARIVGAAASALPVPAQPASDLEQQLAQLFDAPDFEVLLTLQDAQLKQLIGARIQQQYQQGAVVLHHGWWLARSELVLLHLGWG